MTKSPGVVLKKKGLIPATYDLRSLSRGQKSWITKQARRFSEVLKKPQEFTTVKLKGKAQRSKARTADFPITNGRAVIHAGPGGSARWTKDGKLKVSGERRSHEVWFASPENFGEVYRKAKRIKLKNNQVWKTQIGPHISNGSWRTFDDLMHYVHANTNAQPSRWHDPQYVEQHISFVLMDLKRAHIIKSLAARHEQDEDEDEE